MTNKESERALKLYDDLSNMIWYHNKNLTKKQEYLLQEIQDFLRVISEKKYREKVALIENPKDKFMKEVLEDFKNNKK